MAFDIVAGQAWTDPRNGPKLDRFPLATMKMNDEFYIPLVKNAKGKLVPDCGFNVKAANELFSPDLKFRKRRDENPPAHLREKYPNGYIIVKCVKGPARESAGASE